ncbi:TPA: hypothetical protein MAJ58_005206 [Klebsiella pneumoniae]|nr:hypothetical protein [Klebsiella pneumoniae]MCY3442861.1 hypothetical protein [Klebsiella pneumoniae]HBS5460036.1 hypothetical protein [Klebsiella pneumoniae]HBT7403224.1 hypothetical protein [Klebsiella pneumoniae]HBV9667207.1 hypothetical protein [Klebsiella pneumoniae]
MTLQAVNEFIASLESAGELSIKETKVMALAKAFMQLAAENVALKNVFSQKEIPSEAVDAFMETAVMDHDWNETSEWSWVENETEVIHAVLDALKPDTPATDRIVAGIKADGVGEFVRRLQQCVDEGDFVGDEVAVIVGAIDCGKEFCEQLREGADKC